MISRVAATNPYLEEFQRLFPTEPNWDLVEKIGPARVKQIRGELCKKFSWAIPNEKALSAIAKYAPLVEMGSGAGYWAHLLRSRGAEVVAFDAFPRPPEECWAAPKLGTHETLKEFPSQTLLLSWPPHGTSVAADCACSYLGPTLIYIGEAEGGCTANDDFFAIVSSKFTLLEKVEIPTWPGVNDAVWIYRRLG